MLNPTHSLQHTLNHWSSPSTKQIKANCYDAIAYFAQIKRPPGMKKKTLRMIKLQYLHKAIEAVLEPLMDMATFGKASLGALVGCKHFPI